MGAKRVSANGRSGARRALRKSQRAAEHRALAVGKWDDLPACDTAFRRGVA